jgi:fructan beta-fructosidase
MPVKELNRITQPAITSYNIKVTDNTVPLKTGNLTSPYKLTVKAAATEDFSFIFSNEAGEKLIVGYDKIANQYYIDRTNAGRNDFSKSFTGKHTAPRIANTPQIQLTMIIDHTSIELFADNGLTTMTGIFFPKGLMNRIHVQSRRDWTIQKLEVSSMKNIW